MRSSRGAYERGDPAAFIRHYEDAARIIQGEDRLPPLDVSLEELVEALLGDGTIRKLPRSTDPAFALKDSERRGDLKGAHAAIGPMFWGNRTSLEEAAERIREWLRKVEGPGS